MEREVLMGEIKYIKPPGSLQELKEAAKRETLSRAGKEAVIENYAKRNGMTIEEARERLGYKSVRAVQIQKGIGNLIDDGAGGVTDESVNALLAKKSDGTTLKQAGTKTSAQEAEDPADDEAKLKQKEPVTPTGMTDEKFDRLDDDTQIVVTAGMLRRFAHMIRAEERLKNRPISLDEMFDIVEDLP